MEALPVGSKPFAEYTQGKALAILRGALLTIGTEDAKLYRTHDFRRGHAKDLQMNGASLYEILCAGEWRSPAFLEYLDLMELEKGVVVEAHLVESSSEGGDEDETFATPSG